MVDLKRKTKNYGIVVEFERVREEDGGVYRCTCTNKGGSTSRDLTLVVEGAVGGGAVVGGGGLGLECC